MGGKMKARTVIITFTLIGIFTFFTIVYYLTNGYAIDYIPKNNIEKTPRVRALDEVLLPVAYYEFDERREYWGYIDTYGEVAIPFEYEETYDFDENYLAIVKKNNRYGLINTRGEKILNTIYHNIQYLGEAIYYIESVNFSGLIKYNDNEKDYDIINEIKYDLVSKFSEGLAYVVLDDMVGYIDTQGNVAIDIKFTYHEGFNYSFMNGYAFVYHDNKIGIIDKNGDYVVEPQIDEVINEYIISLDFQDIYFSHFEMIPFRIDNKWGYMAPNGAIILEPFYEEAYPFFDGIARVKKYNKYNYIRSNGEVFQLDGFKIAKDFYNGYAVVVIDTKAGLIDSNGELIIQYAYDYIGSVNQGRVLTVNKTINKYLNINDVEDYFTISSKVGDDFTDCGVFFALNEKDSYQSYVIYDYQGNRVYKEITPLKYIQINYHNKTYIKMIAYEEASNLTYLTYLDENGKLLWKVYKNE